MLALLLHAHLPLVTVHLWRVVLWLEYFWRVRYAAISLLEPVGELTLLQSTSVRTKLHLVSARGRQFDRVPRIRKSRILARARGG